MTPVPADSPLRGAPTMLAPAGDLPAATAVATPQVRALLGYTRRLLHLPDGHTFGIFSFSNSGPANWLFLVDGNDLTVRRYAIPQGDVASHGGALGADGDVYVMPYGNNRVHRFRVATETFETTEVPITGQYSWDALGASNGRIYFGTYPDACLGEYDPATGKLRLWQQVAPNTKYVVNLSEDTLGRIHCDATGPDQVPMIYDPASDRLAPAADFAPAPAPPASPGAAVQPAAVPEPDTDWRGLTRVGDMRYSVSNPSGRLWEMAPDGTTRLLGETQAFGEPQFWLANAPGAVVGISYFGIVFRYDLRTGEFRRAQMDNLAPGGNTLMFIEAVGGRWVVGANYSQQNLFRLDMDTGEVAEPPWQIASQSGEPMCAVGFGSRAYLGIYVQSVMMRYDADQPFGYLTNPRPLFTLGDTYRQVRPRAAVQDGRRVYITSDSAYNALGGALVVIDPANDAVQVYHQLIQDQNLPTLALDPTTGLVWGGTDRWGQMRSHPPTRDSSLIYAFDAATGKVTRELVLWPGSDVTNVIGVSADGILVASSGDQLALVQTASGQVLYQGAAPFALPGRIVVGADGMSYCLSGGYLCRWDFRRNELSPVVASGNAIFLTEVRPGLWALADSTTVYKVSVPAAN